MVQRKTYLSTLLFIDKFERRKIFVIVDVIRFGNNLPVGIVEGRNLICF